MEQSLFLFDPFDVANIARFHHLGISDLLRFEQVKT